MSTPKDRGNLIVIFVAIALAALIYVFLSGPGAFHFGKLQSNGTSTAGTIFSQVATSSAGDIGVVSAQTQELDSADHLNISVSKPVVSIAGQDQVSQKINQDISQTIDAAVSDFKTSASDVTNEPSTSSVTIDFEVVYKNANQNILSIQLDQSFYSAGAAHPSHEVVSLNYNTKTGEKITLQSLFVPDVSYLSRLSEFSIQALQNKLGQDANMDTIQQGASPDADNFDVFFITSAGLRIVFNEYQVAPYSLGVQEITISYDDLKYLYDINGPLAPFYK
ncbi:MAG: DUF3298 domain-containing protein [Candidatus Pacebacteria bacterium]|nr:DUF3298 domain-containing protein [Candidatus Paceibacterota bacterium]